MTAFKDLAVEDDAAADTGAEGKQYHAPGVAPGANPVFAKGSGVAVVLKGRGQVKSVGDVLTDGNVFPGFEVGRIDDNAGLQVHESGGVHADGGDVLKS